MISSAADPKKKRQDDDWLENDGPEFDPDQDDDLDLDLELDWDPDLEEEAGSTEFEWGRTDRGRPD